MLLAFDVETSGLLARDPATGQMLPLDNPAHPHIVQIGAVMVDREFKEVACMRSMVRPDGWAITSEAEAVHGISLETATRYGLPLKIVLSSFVEMVKRSPYVCAFNFEFDATLIKIEIARLGSDDPGLHRPRIRVLDPMKLGAASMSPTGQYPSLMSLYRTLTGEEYASTHDGLDDARAALTCVQCMIANKSLEL